MAWNEKQELAKAAIKIAKEKHPEGFNKSQLIEASKEVNGGFSTASYKQVKTYEDVSNLGNHMANIDGHYPLGMSACEVVGINGDCGFRCPAFLDGDCKNTDDITKEEVMESDDLDDQEKHDLAEIYF